MEKVLKILLVLVLVLIVAAVALFFIYYRNLDQKFLNWAYKKLNAILECRKAKCA